MSKLKTWEVIERLGAAKAAAIEIVEGATEPAAPAPAQKSPKPKAAKKAKAKAEDVAEADA